MSRIVNTNFGPAGTTTAAANANTKFTDVATATGAIDESNVRHEGIDRRNLADNFIMVRSAYVDNGNLGEEFTYSLSNSHAESQPVNHAGSPPAAGTGLLVNLSASPVVLKAGDLLRIHHSCMVSSHPADGLDTGVEKFFMATYPEWDITSAALTGFVPMGNLDPAIASDGLGYTVVDLESRSSAGVALYPMNGVRVTSPSTRLVTNRSGFACLQYKHTGADVTVYGVRINVVGPYRYIQNTTGSTFRAWATQTTAATITSFRMTRGHMSLMQMRGGQP